MILAIDPGSIESAYVLMDRDYKPIQFDKVENNIIIDCINEHYVKQIDTIVIEMIASYGMPVGKDVFETVKWIGRFEQVGRNCSDKIEFIYRKDEKMNLCGSTKARDSNIRQALIDRFGEVGTNGIGTKKKPLYFYGFHDDIWAAYAVGVTYLDKVNNAK